MTSVFFFFLVTNDIERHLLLGRKVMTNLDSILKSRDFTFWAPKSLQMMIEAMKLKDTYSLEGKL